MGVVGRVAQLIVAQAEEANGQRGACPVTSAPMSDRASSRISPSSPTSGRALSASAAACASRMDDCRRSILPRATMRGCVLGTSDASSKGGWGDRAWPRSARPSRAPDSCRRDRARRAAAIARASRQASAHAARNRRRRWRRRRRVPRPLERQPARPGSSRRRSSSPTAARTTCRARRARGLEGGVEADNRFQQGERWNGRARCPRARRRAARVSVRRTR